MRASRLAWVAALALGVAGPAHALIEMCVDDGNGMRLKWFCACPGPSGQKRNLSLYCNGAQDEPNCHTSTCLWAPGNPPRGGMDKYQCCAAGITCGTPGLLSYNCTDCPLGQSCNDSSDMCQKGTCQRVPLADGGLPEPKVNLTTGELTGGEWECGNTSPDSSCRAPHSQSCQPTGGPGRVGDPIVLASGTTVHEVEDARLDTAFGALTLRRTYVSTPKTWAYAASLGTTSQTTLPKPFGASPGYGASLLWSHNFYSFVVDRPGQWLLRDTEGQALSFSPCGTDCFGAPAEEVAESRDRLYRGPKGFTLYRGSGQRYVYESEWNEANATRRYFLTRVEDGQYPRPGESPRVLARLSYALPSPNCRGAGASGVPYLAEVATPEGSRLRFRYQAVGTECVVAGATLLSPGGSETPLVEYRYATQAAPDGGAALSVPGLLAAVAYGVDGGGGLEEYEYARPPCGHCPPQPAWVVKRDGVEVTAHLYGSDGKSPTDYFNGQKTVSQVARTPGGCGPNACTSATTQSWETYASAADGSGARYSRLVHHTVAQVPFGLGGRVSEVRDDWLGTQAWSWAVLDAGLGLAAAVPTAEQTLRGHWTTYQHQAVTPAASTWPQVELRRVSVGAPADGGSPLTTAEYGYTYGGQGQAPRAFEQLKTSESRPSVLAPNEKAETVQAFDTATNRLKATFQVGHTRAWDAAASAWRVEKRTVGTFYFTRPECEGGLPDVFGRTLEVHGPCLAEGVFATDCRAGQPMPVTRYEYFGATSDANAHRLKRVSRQVSNGGPADCQGKDSLATEYGDYDAFGNARNVTDANGVVTTRTFEGKWLTSSTVAGATTRYVYEKGKLVAIRFPEGNFEVFCYRASKLQDGCLKSAAWTGKLQWQAKAGDEEGKAVSEALVFGYWPDGRLKTKQSWDGAGPTLRKEESFDDDAMGLPAWHHTGKVGAPGAFAEPKGYDVEGNLGAVGFAFNGPPAVCRGLDALGRPRHPGCAALAYDGASRLIGLDEAGAAAPSSRTCFAYDAHGNVKSVTAGCPKGAVPGDCGGCTQKAAEYQHDDFGNLVVAKLPSASGEVSFEYDAQGNLVRKQTPSMAPNGEFLVYTHDSLGRPLSLVHTWARPSAGAETLWAYGYDGQGQLHVSCPQPANTQGRVRYRVDSFGQTWFAYDSEGRVTTEVRLRHGVARCEGASTNQAPHTRYVYSPNGNLREVHYPFGRTVAYGYAKHPGGVATDRPAGVSVTLWDGARWEEKQVLSAIRWEPYSGLRSYQAHHLGSGTRSLVEYWLGDDGSSPPPASCTPAATPTSPGDSTGRLRALWVSRDVGNPTGDVFRRTYQWQADQLVRADTCLLGAASAQVESYGYDAQLRLVSASRPAGNLEAAGGAYSSLTYGYDGRGNRRAQSVNGCADSLAFDGGFPDRLARVAPGCKSMLTREYGYDADGRVVSVVGPKDSSGKVGFRMDFRAGTVGPDSHGALDSVFKAASVSGAVYGYYYDANNRRRLKVYPAGPTDEFFYDVGHQLLVDRGNGRLVRPDFHVDDDYVWLGGRPVAVVRGKLTKAFARESDSAVDCARNGEPAACGVYFPVTDVIGKPVLVLDGKGKVSAVLDYEPFGGINQVALRKDTAHPYPANQNVALGDFGQAAHSATQVQYRVHFGLVDTEGDARVPADSVLLVDSASGAPLARPVGGHHRGRVWTGWVEPPSGKVRLGFKSDSASCCPDGRGGVACAATACAGAFPYVGAAVEGYEYRRAEKGAGWFAVPLRFPGQYADAESGLFENWNRYYDPSIGRYLQPEPLLSQRPMDDPSSELGKGLGVLGLAVNAYSYAGSNPVNFVDPDGLKGKKARTKVIEVNCGGSTARVSYEDDSQLCELWHTVVWTRDRMCRPVTIPRSPYKKPVGQDTVWRCECARKLADAVGEAARRRGCNDPSNPEPNDPACEQ